MISRAETTPAPRRRAFTLIECLAVLATIFVLAVVSVPIFKVYVLGEAGRPMAPEGEEGYEKRKTYDLRFGNDAAEMESVPSPPQSP